MQVLLENVSALRRRLLVRVPAQGVEQQARARVLAMGRTAQLRGFRPGKIPHNVLERTFGAQVRSEALAEAVSSSLREAIVQTSQRPALTPTVGACTVNGDQIEYVAEFEVFPEVPHLDVSTLALTAFESCVEDGDIDAAITALQEEHGQLDEKLLLSLGIREGGLTAPRELVRADLQQQLKAAIQFRTKSQVMQQLSAAYSEIEVPRGLVDNEVRALMARAGEQATGDSATLADEAEVRVRAFILLAEIARQNDIAPDQNRINATLAQIASEYEEPDKVVELYAADADLMASLRNRVIEDQAVDWVVAHAKMTSCQIAFNALVQAHPSPSGRHTESAAG